jgi:hypothetical protein
LSPNWRDWPPEAKQRLLTRLQAEAGARRPRDFAGWAAHHGIHLWSAQRAVAASVEQHKRTAVRAGHAVGKSFLAAAAAAWWTDTRPNGLVISTAPSSHQVHGILWEEIRGLHRRLRLGGMVGLDDNWTIDRRQVAFGRKPPDAAAGSDFDPSTFQGYHRPDGVLFIIDEAGGVPTWLWTAAETVTTSDNCRILAIGNPDNPGSRFAEVCTAVPGWQRYKIAVADSPNFTGEAVPDEVAAALVTRLWEEDRRIDWGEDNPLFVSKVLAEFPSDHPQQVIPMGALASCWLAEPRSPAELVPVELGVDVGGGGDWTIIRERRGIRAGRRWAQRTPEPEQAGNLLMHAIRETGATSVKVDAIGVGWGLAGEARNRISRGDLGRGCAIHAVMVSEKSSDPAKYANLRAELWWTIGRESSQQQTWDLSAMEGADTTNAQLLIPRWQPDAKGRIQIESKDDIRSRTGGQSPDDADALLLAYHVPKDGHGAYWSALTSGRLRG